MEGINNLKGAYKKIGMQVNKIKLNVVEFET
jgi:hypothetical protein